MRQGEEWWERLRRDPGPDRRPEVVSNSRLRGRHWARNGIVFDPGIPAETQHELTRMQGLVPFAQSLPPAPPVMKKASSSAMVTALSVGGTFFWGLLAAGAFKEGWHIFFLVSLGVTGVGLLGALALIMETFRTGWTTEIPPEDHLMRTYRHRYVLPGQDFNDETGPVWGRASAASDIIRQSEVIAAGLVDSVEITVVLPYHLWSIARDLAHLTMLRTEQNAILAGIDVGHDQVASVLDPQEYVQRDAAKRIEKLVRDLEAFADLVTEADEARRREVAIARLAELNDSHLRLRAQRGPGGNHLASDGAAAQNLRALTRQTDEAVRRANEAGRALILPVTRPAPEPNRRNQNR